jgi:ElaB/YqjD/DUF883 family membrane-anchored ribosome-binding protein
MDSEQDRELEMIRDQMHQTRASLADKLGTLESQVRDTVDSATTAVATATEAVTTTVEEVKEVVSNVTESVSSTVSNVTDTVQGVVSNVTESVQDTVSSVASAFDVPGYVRAAPFASVGCSMMCGFLGGYLLGGSSRSSASKPASTNGDTWSGNGREPAHAAPGAPSQAQPAPSSPEEQQKQENVFGEMLTQAAQSARSLGVTALLGTVSQLAHTYLPDMAREEAGKVLNDFSLKLGGKPLPRPTVDNANKT